MKPVRKRKTKDHPDGRAKVTENIESSLLESYFQGTEMVNRGLLPISKKRDSYNCPASFQNSWIKGFCVVSIIFFPDGRICYCYPVPMSSVYAKRVWYAGKCDKIFSSEKKPHCIVFASCCGKILQTQPILNYQCDVHFAC